MLKRIAILGVTAAGAIIGLTAAPASAQQYPPHVNIVTVSSPCPGATATISGTVTAQDNTPLANTPVTVTVDGATVGTPVTDSAGRYSLETTAPNQVGDHPVTAVAPDSAVVNGVLKVVSCDAAAAPPRPDLPRTGSSDSTMSMVKVGVALTALGGALLAVAQKRRRRNTAIA